eukprot:5472210-Pleurochrysis_carterae.AAC.1
MLRHAESSTLNNYKVTASIEKACVAQRASKACVRCVHALAACYVVVSCRFLRVEIMHKPLIVLSPNLLARRNARNGSPWL